jgi:hypothetical protein
VVGRPPGPVSLTGEALAFGTDETRFDECVRLRAAVKAA